jgi:hypothetical protein
MLIEDLTVTPSMAPRAFGAPRMGAVVTHAMTAVMMVVVVVVVMPARGTTVHGMIMPRGGMGFVACESRAWRKNDSGTEKQYAEEFHWSLPMYLITAMVGRAF